MESKELPPTLSKEAEEGLITNHVQEHLRWLPPQEQEHFRRRLETEGATWELYRSFEAALDNDESARLKLYTKRYLTVLPHTQQWMLLFKLYLGGFTQAWRNSVDEAVRQRGEFFRKNTAETIAKWEQSDDALLRREAKRLKSLTRSEPDEGV